MSVISHDPDEGCSGCPFLDNNVLCGATLAADGTRGRRIHPEESPRGPDMPAPEWCELRKGSGVTVIGVKWIRLRLREKP